MNDKAERIRTQVTARQAAERYGLKPDRAGFLHCPFHAGDHTPSLKLFPDGGWHCFGCGKGGSSIDLVMELFGLTFSQACTRLNRDFALGLPMGRRMTYADKRRAEEASRKRRQEKRAEEDTEALELALLREHRYWWEVQQVFMPDQPPYIHPLYEEAVKVLPYLGYLLDELAETRWRARREKAESDGGWMQRNPR